MEESGHSRRFGVDGVFLADEVEPVRGSQVHANMSGTSNPDGTGGKNRVPNHRHAVGGWSEEDTIIQAGLGPEPSSGGRRAGRTRPARVRHD